MPFPEFEDLPFDERPDLTPYLVHLTKNTKDEDEFSAFDNLVSILKEGEIWASTKNSGLIKGPHSATCFTDVPFSALKYVLNPDNTDPDNPRYEPYGIVVTEKNAVKKGCRQSSICRMKRLIRLEFWMITSGAWSDSRSQVANG
jgi:hypothetical protein